MAPNDILWIMVQKQDFWSSVMDEDAYLFFLMDLS